MGDNKAFKEEWSKAEDLDIIESTDSDIEEADDVEEFYDWLNYEVEDIYDKKV